MQKFILAGLLFLFSISLGQNININEQERTYLLHLPKDYQAQNNYPLVVLLHGANLSAKDMIAITDFNSTADKHGFIALYPNGQNKSWDYLSRPELNSDTLFIKSLVAKITKDYNVDSNRIYLAGFSNGGFMAERMLCENEGLFAAFASVSAQIFRELPIFCATPKATSILLIHGTADHILPFDGSGRQLPSVTGSFEYWLQYLSCSTDVLGSELDSIDEETRVSLFKAQDCANNQDLYLYVVVNGGHNWPGHTGFIPFSIAGHTSKDIDASELLWEFFSKHSLAD